MTKDELLAKVAEKLDEHMVKHTCVIGWVATVECGECKFVPGYGHSCHACWATAIVNLVKECEEGE